MFRTIALISALGCALPAFAERTADGELNPDELSLSRAVQNARDGKVDIGTCAAGYLMTKSGQHESARDTFTACADAGYTGAMAWMSYMEQNGFGGEFNPDAAAEWDRRAAEMGDPIGQFNYGVSLIRGFGVNQDVEAGRKLVDLAANQGLPAAQRLQGADYDLDEVTPDADNWRYAPAF